MITLHAEVPRFALDGADSLKVPPIYIDRVQRDCQRNGVRGSSLIRKEMAVTDTIEVLEEVMIDPVTGEIIDSVRNS